MPPKKGKKGGKKQDDDCGEDDKKVTFSFFKPNCFDTKNCFNMY